MGMIGVIFYVVMVTALVFVRFRREPRWVGMLRLALAMLITWNALASWESSARLHRMRERSIAGAAHAYDYDTGGGAAMMLFGWAPAALGVG